MTGSMHSGDTVLPEELVALARKVVEANKAIGRRLVVAESWLARWRP